MMEFYNHIGIDNSLSNPTDGASEFESDAYMEYRRRVFEQLAVECEREKQLQGLHSIAVDEEQNQQSTIDLHSSNVFDVDNEDANKPSTDSQPSWDDSDLLDETYNLSPPQYLIKNASSVQNTSHSFYDFHVSSSLSDNSEKAYDPSKQLQRNEINATPGMNWGESDEHIPLKLSKLESTATEMEKMSPIIHTKWRGIETSSQKQKQDREAIRQKLCMEDDDEYEVDSLWPRKTYERSYPANNQALHICYINQLSDSDDSESESSKSQSTSPFVFSPTSSPGCPRGYGGANMIRASDTSSSQTSSPSVNVVSETTDVKEDYRQGCHLPRTKQEQLEIEARFQLAQVQSKAKLEAEKERSSVTQDKTISFVHRLLSVTLPDDVSSKIKTFSLTRSDCRLMSVAQLQLILNEMHTKKQELNEELMSSLMQRDDLQTVQDARLFDIEKAKSMLNAAGPETTV